MSLPAVHIEEVIAGGDDDALVAALDGARASVGRAQRLLLERIAALADADIHIRDGARDFASWLAARLGVTNWVAARLAFAASAIDGLPLVSDALASGRLSIDKTLELVRLATPATEARLLPWAQRVSPSTIRRRADQAKRDLEAARGADRMRYLRWGFSDDDNLMHLEGLLPADQGAIVAKALDRLAGALPDICMCASDTTCGCHPEERDHQDARDIRRADALVGLCSTSIADDADADRATVVVHVDAAALLADDGGAAVEHGPLLHASQALRLACDCRLQTVHEHDGLTPGIGRTSRVVPRWLLRQLIHRDGCCTFPGCNGRRSLHAHHILHWVFGGPTELDNLLLVCSFHHRLLHEHGWGVLLREGIPRWFRPNRTPFEPWETQLPRAELSVAREPSPVLVE